MSFKEFSIVQDKSRKDQPESKNKADSKTDQPIAPPENKQPKINPASNA
jgi:hypothetical protein